MGLVCLGVCFKFVLLMVSMVDRVMVMSFIDVFVYCLGSSLICRIKGEIE